MRLKDYLTAKQVKAYATTPRKALKISIEHHWQNSQLTQKQFKKLISKHIITNELCGLCAFDKHFETNDYCCKNCPLAKLEDDCYEGDNTFSELRCTFFAVKKGVHTPFNKTAAEEANFAAFIKAEKQMHKVLCSLRGKSAGDIGKMRQLK